MRPLVILISTLSLSIFTPIVRAQGDRTQAFFAAHESEDLWNYERSRSIDLADDRPSTTVNIADLPHDSPEARLNHSHQTTIIKYTHQIEALDRANDNATLAAVTINNAKKAALYNRRGLAKLQLGDKRGAIDDLTLAAELFDELGLNEVSSRSLQIVRTIEN